VRQFLLAAGLLTCAPLLSAEAQTAQSSRQGSVNAAAESEANKTAPAVDPTQGSAKPTSGAGSKPSPDHKWSRWFDLQTATLTARYRFTENSQQVTNINFTCKNFKNRTSSRRTGSESQ
jgi:hypothetical protein